MHQHYFSFRFHLLLDVASMLSSFIDRERRPIRIKFLTLQGKPNSHAWGTKSLTQHLPFLSHPWIRVTPRLQSTATLHPHVARMRTMQCSKRVKVKSTRRSNQVLQHTDYHISRHVVSAFKCLTTTTVHCGLSTLSLTQWGPMIPP